MSAARHFAGHWIRPEALARLADLRLAFDRNRDPLIARQLDDLGKSEAQRRGESISGQGGDPPPAPALKPRGAGRGSNQDSRWLAGQRDGAFAYAADGPERPEGSPDPSRNHSGPSL